MTHAHPLAEGDRLALARTARETLVCAPLFASTDAPSAPARGMAQPAVLRIDGPDAASYLHSQLTHDVEGLLPGAGQLTARVERTGHLVAVAGLHRDPSEPHRYWMIGDVPGIAAMHASLDAFLFADDVTLTPDPSWHWLALQGPAALAVADAVFGPLGFEPWDSLPEGAMRALRRTRKALGIDVPSGSVAIRRSLTGDAGLLIGLPVRPSVGVSGEAAPQGPDTAAAPLIQAIDAAAREAGGAVVSSEAFADVLGILRIEAGIVRPHTDFGDRRRLLPETGLEQTTVSYTKGCYLGQEVIARVRTYGSVPNLLRALVFTSEDSEGLLRTLPAPGADLLLADGKKAGAWAAATHSPLSEGVVALAFLGRAHRTPGSVLEVLDADGVPHQATVRTSPLYAAPDRAHQVRQRYDQAIRTFADGHADRALTLMEDVLRIDPGFADAYEAIGVMLGKSGRFHEAIDVFRRLEEVAPDEPMVNTNLSLYFMKIGDRQTAEDEAGKATLKQMARARGKGGVDVAADLAASKRKEAERKVSMFERVLGIDPDDGIALFGLGTALLTLDRAAEAEPHLARALAVDRKNSAVYAAHGRALEALDRPDDAVGTYRQGVEVASRQGDLMPLKEMEHRLMLLGASRATKPATGPAA